MRIALDAMGGDHAPEPIVAGAIQAVCAEPELTVVLVGDQAQVEPLLPSGPERQRLELFHCSQVVGMEEKPVEALRRKPDNSIKRCWELLAAKKVDGIVSAGNTGAMVAGGHFLKRFLPGVLRPGIAAVLPTEKGPCVLLDVGANIHAKPEHLFQYGIMGAIYARSILQVEQPRIGLMNVGEEEAKGHDLARDTHVLFAKANGPLRERFVGNVEGRDIHKGAADVVVCDGFVGNVVLKYSEGVFEFLMKIVHKEVLQPLEVERERAERSVRELIVRYDYSTYGGAPLLGIDGACIICHGSSGERAIKNALLVASRYARAHLNEVIVKELEANPPPTIE
ncbi:MAG: phosphate acyltransferase PlsX [Gemmataceae bacterium]